MDPEGVILDALAKGREVKATPFAVLGCVEGDLILEPLGPEDDYTTVPLLVVAEYVTIDGVPLAEFLSQASGD